MMKELEKYFESKVEIPLIRQGKKQRVETLINEETLLLAKYLRDERSNWMPRVCARELKTYKLKYSVKTTCEYTSCVINGSKKDC